MQNKILKNAGLSDVQAEIYAFLLENGENKASVIAKNTKRPRGVVYKGLDDLLLLGLIEKIENKGITRFKADHPGNLEKMMEKKEKQIGQEINNKKNRLEMDRKSLENALPDLVSVFNLTRGKPGIKYYEGIEGMQTVYNEIIQEGKDFYLIRSAYEPTYERKILPIVKQFIKKRIAKNIKVTAITPTDLHANPDKDSEWLMTRFMVDEDKYNAPVEIDIFGNKIAILSFGDELISMIIESKQIAQSLKQIFMLATLSTQTKKPAEGNSADQENDTQLA